MLLLPLAVGWALQGRAHNRRLQLWNKALVALMLVWFAESTVRFLMDADAFGHEQRAFVIMFSLWFVQVLRATQTAK